MFIFLTLFLFHWASAHDLSCSPIDLRPQMGAARDQGITMWCYAHSAAELVTQRLGQRVSAFDLAATYLLEDSKPLFKSKHPLIQNALAHDPYFSSRLKRWRLDEPLAYQTQNILTDKGLYYIGGMEQDAILLSAYKGYCLDQNLPGSDLLFKKYLRDIKTSAHYLCGRDGITKCQFHSTAPTGEITQPRSQVLAQIFQHWVDSRCQKRIVPTEPLVAVSVDVAESFSDYQLKLKKHQLNRYEVQDFLFNEINRNLNQGKAVSIGYDLLDIAPPEEESLATEMDHSSVIAARKKINGVCHYFVRTHMGFSCPYLDSVKGLCEAQQGGLWVSRKNLPSLYSVVHIKN